MRIRRFETHDTTKLDQTIPDYRPGLRRTLRRRVSIGYVPLFSGFVTLYWCVVKVHSDDMVDALFETVQPEVRRASNHGRLTAVSSIRATSLATSNMSRPSHTTGHCRVIPTHTRYWRPWSVFLVLSSIGVLRPWISESAALPLDSKSTYITAVIRRAEESLQARIIIRSS